MIEKKGNKEKHFNYLDAILVQTKKKAKKKLTDSPVTLYFSSPIFKWCYAYVQLQYSVSQRKQTVRE